LNARLAIRRVAALTRAIELARQESPATQQQIDDMVRERGWERARGSPPIAARPPGCV
jgi:hypothetical protein